MTKAQVNILAKALQDRFGGEVQAEQVNDQGRYRFAVTSQQFEAMPHLRRQDVVWEVVDATLPREAVLDVSIVLAYAPSDLAAAD